MTLPRAGAIGGGGFMLVRRADLGKTVAIDCYSKVEMSPLSKVEMSPFAEAGGGRFERGRFGDERDGAGAV